MKCRACKCVWYCDKKCQNKHWKEHEKECKPIKKELDKRGGKLDAGTELDVGPLGKMPPQEECPICMQVLPVHERLHFYSVCCGKIICGGCEHQHQTKNKEWAAKRGQKTVPRQTCAFCRTTAPGCAEEALARLSKRVELKDPNALRCMAMENGNGGLGLPVDQAKCIELLHESAGLGFPSAQYHLGSFYRFGEMGLEQNEEEALKYLEEAAEGGHLCSRYHAGCAEKDNGNYVAAMRHFRLSASGGHRRSTEALIAAFAAGLLHHCDLAQSLRAFYCARAEMKSEDRDKFISYLRSTGKNTEEYDV